MDLSRIYTKTSRGILDGSLKASALTREHGRLLALIDGKSTVNDLLEKNKRLSENRLAAIIDELVSGGFIRLISTSHSEEEDLGFSSTIIVDEANTQAFFEAQAAAESQMRRAEDREARDKVVAREALLKEVSADIAAEAAELKRQDAERRNAPKSAGLPQTPVTSKPQSNQASLNKISDSHRPTEKSLKAVASTKPLVRAENADKGRLEKEAAAVAGRALEAKIRAEEDAQRNAEMEARLREMESAKNQAQNEVQTLSKALDQARVAAELENRVKRRMEARAREEAETRERLEAEAHAKLAAEAKLRAEAEAKALAEAEAKARAEAEAAAKLEAERKARLEAEERARVEAEARAKAEAEAQARLAEEKRLAEEARVRAEEEARRQAEAEAEAKLEIERKARKEAETRAKAEAEAKAQLETERRAAEKARMLAEQEARRLAEAMREAEEKARLEAERRAAEEARMRAEEEARRQAEAEEKAMREAEEKARREAEEKARLEAEKRATEEARARAEEEARQAAERARREAEAEAKLEAERRARLEAEQARAEAEARAEAQREAQRDAERRAEEEAQARAAEEARRAAEEAAAQERRLAEQKARAEAEQAQAAAEAAARAEAEALAIAAAEEAVRQEAEAAKHKQEEQQREAEVRRLNEAAARALEEEREAQAQAEMTAQSLAAERAQMEQAAKGREQDRQRAREEANAKARAEMEEAMHRAEEEKEREVREESRLREEAEARAQAAAKTANLPFLTERKRKPFRFDRRAMKSLSAAGVALLVLAIALAHVLSFSFYVPKLEQQLTQSLGQRVAIQDLHFSSYPMPHWALDGVTIGDGAGLRIARASLFPTLASWFSDAKSIQRAELEGLSFSERDFSALAQWRKQQLRTTPLRFEHLQLKDAKFSHPLLDVFTFNAVVDVRRGQFAQATIQSSDQRFNIKLLPQGEALRIELEATKSVLPFEPRLPFDSLKVLAEMQAGVLTLKTIDAQLLDGYVSGAGEVSWAKGWNLKSDLVLKQIALEPGLARFTRDTRVSGTLEAKLRVVAQSDALETLFNAPQVQATFRVKNGEYSGIDLVRAIQAQSRGGNIGGKTHFTDLSGYFQYAKGSYQYRQFKLQGGVVSASGNVDIGPEKKLSGSLIGDFQTKIAKQHMVFNLSGNLGAPELKVAGAVRRSAPAPQAPAEEVQ